MLTEFVQNWLSGQGLSEQTVLWASGALFAIGLALLAVLSNYVVKRIVLGMVHFAVRKSPTTWDDILADRKVFSRLSHLAPALVFYFAAGLLEPLAAIVEKLAVIYMLMVGLSVWSGFLSAAVDIYQTFEISKGRPIKSYIQVIKIISFVLVGLIAVASLLGKSVMVLLGGLGALSAVLILVFKDSILGLVAGIQLSTNDMVKRGDWIEMPKFGADGDVIDVSLNTIKIQNWDKTIVTIPSYAMISDSFKNWRGMKDCGGRRIKRSICIDINSVKFCSPEILDRFERFEHLTEYIRTKREEVSKYNADHNVDTSELINGRRLTNIGTFRAYLVHYLRKHPLIDQNMTFLVRHLPLTERGLPIEIYLFSSVQEWAAYEDIQADIMDHILAVMPLFDLRLFQNPTGNDFRELWTGR